MSVRPTYNPFLFFCFRIHGLGVTISGSENCRRTSVFIGQFLECGWKRDVVSRSVFTNQETS